MRSSSEGISGLKAEAGETGIDLSVIVVSWNTRDLLRDCLASIFRATPRAAFEVEVILVDNASTDDSSDMAAREFPAVRLIRNAENRGFAAANNQGVREARGRHILLLNPDTRTIGDAFGVMIRFLDGRPEAGGVCPMVVNADGSVQSLGRSLPGLGGVFVKGFFPDGWTAAVRGWVDRIRGRAGKDVLEVPGFPGAAMMIPRRVLDGVGLLDEDLPFYAEDIDLCRRIAAQGRTLYCLPGCRIVHLGGRSAGLTPVWSEVRSRLSLYAFLRKHRTPPIAAVARVLIVVSSILRFFSWTVPSLAAGPRTRRRAAREREACRALIRWGLGSSRRPEGS